MANDIAIRGALVIDGSGAPGKSMDIAIRGGRIAELGQGLSGEREIDAKGLVAAPGFIDGHTHYDAQVFWDPALTPSCLHGVTSVVAGNCGFSVAPLRAEMREILAYTLETVEDMVPATLLEGVPWEEFVSFAEYRAAVERRNPLLNFAAYVGHTTLRLHVMGEAAYEREADEGELAQMADELRKALGEGALGFASSFAPTHQGWKGMPVPSRFSSRAEFDRLADVVGEHGRGAIEIAIGQQLMPQEVYALQRRVGVPVTFGALMAIPGIWQMMLDLHNKEVADGANVWPQVTPRPITMQMQLSKPFQFNQAPLFKELIGRPQEEREASYRDPGWRQRALEEVKAIQPPPKWGSMLVDESDAHPDLVGRRVVELANERDVHPFELILELSLAEGLSTRFKMVLFNDDDEGVREILASDHTALCFSDAGAHVGMLCDACMCTDVLGRWVREEGVLSLERAVHKMTGELADLWQLNGRGYLREGYWADLVLFDPESVAPGPIRRVRDFPANEDRLTADQPEGVHHVMVNGTSIVESGQGGLLELEKGPGRFLEPGIPLSNQ